MRLDELRGLITASSRSDWHKITCWGAGSGPSYHDRFSTWSRGATGATEMASESHGNVAIYRADIDLSIAWGLSRDGELPGERPEELTFDWAERFANSKVTASYADIFWRGALVDREVLVHVDGARAALPMPRLQFDEPYNPVNPGPGTETVSEWELAFARLVHGFELRPETFDEYVRRVDWRVVAGFEDESK